MTSRQRTLGISLVLKVSVVLALLFFPALHQASRVRPVNLEEMTRRADRVVSGRTIDVRVTRDSRLGLEVTLVTVRIDRAVKWSIGTPPGRSLTIKLLGGQGTESRGTSVAGMPRFRPGEEIVLFLYGESPAGFTSPVGFGQGKFVVFEDKQGRRRARNDSGNRNLFRGLSSEAAARLGDAARVWRDGAGIPPETLLGMVDSLQRRTPAGTPAQPGEGGGP